MPKISQQLERELDRIEDRLMDAPDGFHALGEPASSDAVAGAGFGEAGCLWSRWDGLELASGFAQIYPLAEIDARTEAAAADGLLVEGDRVVGEYETSLIVVPADAWEEGAEILWIEDDGERMPFASSAPRLVSMLLADVSVLLDEEGEYREDVFADDGELRPETQRKMQRRRLDQDQDAPLPRYRIAQLLLADGEFRGARREFERTIKRAPNFLWAHYDLGRACLSLGDDPAALGAFREAAALTRGRAIHAFSLAWIAMLTQDDAERERLGREVRGLRPTFVLEQEEAARVTMERGDEATARERVRLGLAVEPRHLGLLDLQRGFSP